MKCSSRGVEMSRLPVPKTLCPSSHAPSLVMLVDVTSCDNVTRSLLRVHVRSDMFHRPAYIIDAVGILARVLDRGADTVRPDEVDWNLQVVMIVGWVVPGRDPWYRTRQLVVGI